MSNERENLEKEVKDYLVEIKKKADEIIKEMPELPDEVLGEYPAMLSQHLQSMTYPTL